MSPLKCIVFDVDDTLYLERDYVRSGFHAVGRRLQESHGVTDFADRCWQHFLAGTRRNTFNLVLDELSLPATKELIKELVDCYRHHEPNIELLPDSLECLNMLKPNFQLAALTGGPIESQRAKVAALGLHQWCEPIVYAGQWGPEFDKPHERAFKELETLTGFTGAELIYVSDNPKKDFVAPLDLGWGALRIRRDLSLHADTPTPQDIREVADLSSIELTAQVG